MCAQHLNMNSRQCFIMFTYNSPLENATFFPKDTTFKETDNGEVQKERDTPNIPETLSPL